MQLEQQIFVKTQTLILFNYLAIKIQLIYIYYNKLNIDVGAIEI